MTKTWSSQQQAIFDFFANGTGNLVVRARAGTGKTTTIVEALNYARREPKILLAAFNKRIADELVGRVTAPNAEVKTLHGLGFAYLRRQWNNVKVDTAGIVDIDRARAAVGKDAPDEIVTLVKKLAAMLKNVAPFTTDIETVMEIAEAFNCEPDDERRKDGWETADVAKAALVARDAAKERDAQGRISFDDMVYIPLANNLARPWFTMVVIDEAQDMNAAQLMLAQRACKRTGRVVVVGDDRQAIYGFRGADSQGVDRLKSELRATELGLTVTYRCAAKIVAVARTMVADFEAAPSAAAGIVDEIDIETVYEHAKAGDFVLSRKNAPLMPICLEFLRRGISARVEGRDVAATLKAIAKKIKARSVPEFIERVKGWAEKQTARSTTEAKGDQISDQAETLIALAQGAVNVAEITGRLDSLFGDANEVRRPMVVCSSVHKAKGLEADRAFVIDFKPRDAEGTNIRYVAVTRAKAHLTWLVAKK